MHKFPKPSAWSLRKFFEKRNVILIKRNCGGLGDILMHRMLFEDFKLLCPDIKVHFAVPQRYMAAVEDHPFVDVVLDCEKVNPQDYLRHHDTTTICGRTEQMNSPFSSPHRSDIWASWCGITLTRHEMHLKISESERREAADAVGKIRNGDGPLVAFCPVSAMYSKDLDDEQIKGVVDGLRKMGCFVYGLHTRPILSLDAPLLIGRNVRNYMALVDAADYVITVDTAAFHVAGALGKPQVGIFSWADGKVYGKYFRNWELVQRHRDDGWSCGPCYKWGECPKEPKKRRKPCVTEITAGEIIEKFKMIFQSLTPPQAVGLG